MNNQFNPQKQIYQQQQQQQSHQNHTNQAYTANTHFHPQAQHAHFPNQQYPPQYPNTNTNTGYPQPNVHNPHYGYVPQQPVQGYNQNIYHQQQGYTQSPYNPNIQTHQQTPISGYISTQAPLPPHNLPIPSKIDDFSIVHEIWVPTEIESAQIDKWFFSLVDPSSGTIGGAKAVAFLKTSNLRQETLRSIWALVDVNKSGSIDKSQFNIVIRLMSIACSPLFAGTTLNMELYNKSMHVKLNLPTLTNTPSSTEQPISTPEVHISPPSNSSLPGPLPQAPTLLPIHNNYPNNIYHPTGPPYPPLQQVHTTHPIPPQIPPYPQYFQSSIPIGPTSDTGPNVHPYLTPSAPIHTPIPIPHHVASSFEDEEFTEFSSANANNDAIDDEEDFSDFSSASLPPAPSALPTHHTDIIPPTLPPNPPSVTPNLKLNHTHIPDLSNDIFDFSIKSNTAPITPIHPPTIPFPSPSPSKALPPPIPIPLPSLPSTPSIPLEIDLLGPVVTYESKLGMPNERMAYFDEIAESDLKAATEDWDDFAEAAPEAPTSAPLPIPPSINTASTILLEDNDMEDFGDFEAHSNTELELLPAAPMYIPTPPISTIIITHVDEDFGDFEAFPVITETQTITDIEITIPPENSSIPLNKINDFDLIFGDLEVTAAPIIPPIQIPLTTTTDANANTSEDFFSDKNNSLLLSTLVTGDTSMRTVQGEVSSVQNFSVSDLDFDADFGDFEDASVKSNISHSSSFSSLTNTHNNLATPAAPILHVSAAQSHVETSKKNLTSSFKQGSYQEFEFLTSRLYESCQYEEALQCLTHAKVLRKLATLSEDKRIAVDNDDLETAVEIKKQIAKQTELLACEKDEMYWRTLCLQHSSSNTSDDSLSDIIEVVAILDPTTADKCRQEFLKTDVQYQQEQVQQQGRDVVLSELEPRLKFYCCAKRRLRIITTLLTTHKDHAKYWKDILDTVNGHIDSAYVQIELFAKLPLLDQQAAKLDGRNRLKNYVNGLVAIVEVGLWISLSCIETFVHEDMAGKTAEKCNTISVEVTKHWNDLIVESKRFELCGREALVDAATLAMKTASLTITYCNLSLRPLEKISNSISGKSLKSHLNGSVTTTINGVDYHRSIVNIWKHNNLEMPQSDIVFRL